MFHTITLIRVFRTLFGIIGLGGFLYQTRLFLQVYYSYHTVSTSKTVPVHNVDLPAITLCPLNRIRRKLFCSKFSEMCFIPDINKYCELYPVLCQVSKMDNFWMYPTEDAMKNITFTYNSSFLIKYGPQPHTLIRSCSYLSNGHYTKCRLSPIKYFGRNYRGHLQICFRLNGEMTASPDAQLKFSGTQGYLYNIPVIKMTADLEISEHIEPTYAFGMIFHIQNPHDISNPVMKGTVLTAGHSYRIKMNIYEYQVLPAPYETHCQDYSKEQKENDIHTPQTQERCYTDCSIEMILKQCGCVKHQYYFSPLTKRTPECGKENNCKPNINAIMQKCFDQCGESCREIVYDTDLEEHPMESENITSDVIPNSLLSVDIYMKYPYMRIYSLKPKIEEVELFSYIGDYMGLWLGVSIFSLHRILRQIIRMLAIPRRLFNNMRNQY